METKYRTEIQANRILGEFIGTIEGVCAWEIPEELKLKLQKQIEELREVKIISNIPEYSPTEQNEIQYSEFVKWMNEKKSFNGFTSGEVAFAKQIFEFLVDYPSFKYKLEQVGSRENVFGCIERYLKENK